MVNQVRTIAITVDTEEEGLWGGGYRVTGNTTENLRGLPRFQAACEEISAPPTYLVDAPVLADSLAIEQMRKWQQQNRCEVGAHCHPWCNPPLPETCDDPGESYLCNLPVDVQREKLVWLTDRIADLMGKAPTSFRAGRYGFNRDTAAILDDLGYVVDSSVLPLFDYRRDGGPDFTQASREPYRYFGDEPHRRLIEVPVTSGFTRPRFDRQRRLWLGLRDPTWRRFRFAGIADRIGISRRVKLSPEKYLKPDLVKLIDSAVQDGMTTMILMLHSSSLVPGMSPYTKTDSDLDLFYDTLTTAVSYAINEYHFRPVTLTQSAPADLVL